MSAPPTGLPWRWVLAISVGATLLWGAEILRRDLWEPDEARYAYVADEMRDEGHWLVPHRHGEYYAHKPPLVFWLMQAGAQLTGGEISRVAARLPSLLGSILTLCVTAGLLRRWADDAAARRGVLVLAAAYLVWKQGAIGQIDALLCGLEMAGLYALFTAGSPARGVRAALAYAAWGAAVLAKGPVGFLVPWGAYLAGTAAAEGPRALRGHHLWWGPILTLAFPAAWLSAAWWTGAPGGYFRELLIDQNVGRAQGAFGHVKPVYYFLLHFPMEFLPWTIALPAVAATLWRERPLSPSIRRLLAWFTYVLVFFSLSSSKRNLYILLAYPAAAMVVAMVWPRVTPRAARWTALTGIALVAILGAGVAVAGFVVPSLYEVPALAFAAVAATLLAGAFWLIRRHRRAPREGVLLEPLAAVILATYALVGGVLLPAFDPLKTPQVLAAVTDAMPPAEGIILLYRMHGEIFPLYSELRGRRLDTPDALEAALREQPHALVVMSAQNLRGLPPDLRRQLIPHSFAMGSKEVVWCERLASRPPDRPRPTPGGPTEFRTGM